MAWETLEKWEILFEVLSQKKLNLENPNIEGCAWITEH